MMELFTLGAGQRLHGDRRPRAGARAHRLAQRLERTASATSTSATTRTRHDTASRRSSASRRLQLEGRRAGSCVAAPDAPGVLRPQALELLRPGAARRGDRSARSSSSTSRRGYEIRPVVDGDPQASRALRRAAAWSSRRSSTPRACCARIGRRIDTTTGSWLGSMAGQQLFYPPNVAGWDDTRWLDTATWRGRWWIAQYVLRPYALDPEHERRSRTTPSAARRRARSRFWHQPRARRPTHAGAPRASRRARSATPPAPTGSAEQYPRHGAERAAPPDRRLAGAADRMSDCNHCDELLALAAPAPRGRRGRARPAGDRAGDAAAGRHGPRRAAVRLARASARRSPSTAARGSALGRFEEGIAAAATAPAQPVLVSIFLDGRRRRALGALAAGRPALPRAAPDARARAGGHAASPRTTACTGIPSLAALAQLYGEGRSRVLPAIGYTNADQSHFTSRHYWEVGATSANLRTGWLGRYLDRVGDDGQPAAGPLARRPAAAVARHGEGAGRVDRRPRPVRLLEQPTSGARSSSACSTRSARSAPGGLVRSRAGARPRASTRAGRPAAQPAPAASTTATASPAFTSPVAYPDRTTFPGAWPGSPRCSPPGLPLRASRSARRALRHALRPGRRARAGPAAHRGLARSPSSATSRRAASPTGCSSHVWRSSGGAPRRTARDGTDHGAAGVGFLIGSRRRRDRWSASSPASRRARRRRQPEATVDFRGVYASLLEQWFGVDARPIIPDAKKMKRLQLVG